MANKPTLPTLVNTGNIQAQLTTINNGYRQIEDEFEKMLSREDNSLPNHMLDALDMDGHKVINVEDGTEGADAVNKSQLDTKEDYLGAPVADGMVLASTTGGERFWTSDLNVLTPTLNVAPKDAKYLVVSPHPTLTNEYSLIAGNGIAFDEGPNYLEVSTDLSEINFEDIALTGVPTAPTAAVGTNTTQVATTAFVNAEIANDAPTKTGGGASGNWNINILGNAETVDGYHVAVDEAGTNPNTIYFRTTGGTDPSAAIWGDISGSIVDQTDLYNALVNGTYATGNWNINAASVDGYNVQVDGTGTDPNTIYFKTTGGTISVDWDDVSNTPTTLAGYGITDAFTETESDARFLGINATAVNSDKVDGYNVQVDGTGTDPNTIYFKTTGGEISVDWDNVLNTPTTVAGYGITDVFTETESDARFLGISATAVNSDKVDGYHVQVDGTGTDPNTIYLKTTGGTVSVDWVDVSGTPTTIAGYGITDAYTKTQSDSNYLGATATAVNSDKIDGYHVQVDGTGTDPNTIYFKTTGGVDPSAAIWGSITGTLAAQTDLQAALDAKVPYTGATGNVNLGEYGLTTGFLQADLTPTSALEVGRMQWNDADGTMDLRLKGNNVTLQLGQEQVIRVVNKTGADLLEANYQCVRISGAQGQRPKVDLAQANNDANSADTIGIVTETITNNEEGFVTNSGMVNNINTTGSLQGETWADGDLLYLSGTVAGGLTKVKPQAPTHTVIVGFVVYAHANHGKIFVKVDNGYEIDELHNVKINGIAGNNVLRYNSTLNVWENVAQTALSVGDANTVDGYHVQVDGTGTDPNTIYFKTTGGGIGVDWDDISNTPTTVAGYGITDAVTTSGNQTIGGTKTFSSTISGSVSGNAGTVTNGVYTTGNQTVGGVKTLSSNPIFSDGGFQYFYHASDHIAYYKKTGAYNWYWRRNDTGLAGGANDTTLMDLNDSGSLTAYGDIRAPVFYDYNNTAYYLNPADTGTSMVVAGNVGIGTTSPINKLTISGSSLASGELGTFAITGNTTAKRLAMGVDSTSTMYSWVQSVESGVGFRSLSLQPLGGNVGIGTTSPTFRLVSANSSTDGGWLYSTGAVSILGLGGYSGATDGAFSLRYNRSSGSITFNGGNRDTPTERMRIDSSGNLGIGTTSPTLARLVVASPANSPSLLLTDNTQSTLTVKHESGNLLTYEVNGTATQRWVGNGSERMRINGSGKVLVGAGATASLGKLVVSEASSGTAVIALESQGSWNSTIACTSTGNLVLRNNGASDRMVFDPYGNIITYGPMFASIYYDNDNSAYYLDPANSGTSMVVAGDVVASNLKTSANTALSLGLSAGTAFNTGGAAIALRGSTTGYNNNGMEFYAGNSERMRIASNGSVGIARVPDTSFALDVGGEVRIINAVGGGFGGTFRLYNSSAGATNPAKHFRIGSTGHLEIINSAYNAVPFVFTDSGSFYAGESVQAPIYYDVNNTAFYVDPSNTGTALNVAGAIQLPNNKSLLFRNVANTASASFLLQSDDNFVVYNASSAPIMSFGQGASTSAVYGANASNRMIVNGSSNIISFNVDGTEKLTINGSGNLVATGNVTAYSDIRVKDNVESIEGAIGKLNQIRGVTYTRTDLEDKERKYAGVIAQEIEQVLPEAVFDNGKVKAVDYNATIALLIEAVKEQQGQINELKLTIEQLKGN